MADVTVECNNFTGTYQKVNGVYTRNFRRRAIFRATMTVGFQRFSSVLNFGLRGLVHRFGIALSALSFLEKQQVGLCLSKDFKRLDRSEKGAVSYWYGMALAKLVAESELGIPWLAHADPLIDSGAMKVNRSTNKRPDLVGRGPNSDWHVIEAKGRSNEPTASLVTGAKKQAGVVKTIKGKPPDTTSACITSLSTKPVSVLLDDPPADTGEGTVEWEIDDKKFFRQYYKGIIRYLKEFGSEKTLSTNDREFVIAPLFPFYQEFFSLSTKRPLPEWRLKLGLRREIFESPEVADEAIDDSQISEDDEIGSDGIAIFGEMPDWETSEH